MNKQCIWCCRTPFPRQQQQHQSSSKRFLKLVLPNYKIDPSTGNFCRLDHDGSFNYRAVNVSALPFRRHLTDGVVLLILLLMATSFCCGFPYCLPHRAGAVVCERRHRDYCLLCGCAGIYHSETKTCSTVCPAFTFRWNSVGYWWRNLKAFHEFFTLTEFLRT